MQSETQLIFEQSKSGRTGLQVPATPENLPRYTPPAGLARESAPRLPEVSENIVVRHYTNLSTRNHHIDRDFYPLGSCTMKYNPKINDEMSALPGFAGLNPWQSPRSAQGALQLMWELSQSLIEVTGMDAITLQPAAGAQGEFTALLMFRAYHLKNGNVRKRIVIPDSAHGTNPASIVLSGYGVTQLPSDENGLMDIEALKRTLDEDVAGLMITNPNTLGLFETKIAKIIDLVHDAGGLVYMDGANLNALLGIARPGDMGFDACHMNLHKTFSTPHGGGGPGSGPVAIKDKLSKFLPLPVLAKKGDQALWDWDRPDSIGSVHTFYGNFGMLVRALTYIKSLGGNGLRAISDNAIINANYLRKKLSPNYLIHMDRPCMHEAVFSGNNQKAKGVRTTDIAKRLLDFGIHPPTVYFPLIVPECLMIEPTESESKETLDEFIDVMLRIDREAGETPELLKNAPYTTPVRRLDEAGAARNLNIRFFSDDQS
ncbi:MAG: aminomethyl-transferring glycine dehydrogenase subunit GcvPB [bacterium]|nr:aminomethyl-transferring glycine dehydrogenase subunit GcvPB [bacterium]MBK8130419.1 aminomethyl-transferring glycine dehydrogenase subunit GcvPB [bacterium]